MKESPHIPVLLHEVLELFADIGDAPGVLIDCTVGYGGHTAALLEAHPGLEIVGIDRDDTALAFCAERFAAGGRSVRLRKGAFSQVLPTLTDEPVVGILADFGVSSLQLDEAERGFGFASQALDMRMDPQSMTDAGTVVNRYSPVELERILRDYGEVRGYRKVARAIVDARERKSFQSARELAELVERILPRGKTHPATQVFQAIRIAVNDELGEIRRLLDLLESWRPGGAVVALISFHSLEDRLVKQRFKQWEKSCICPPEAPRCRCGNDHALGRILTKKPIVAAPEEIRKNSRSRSAKLRAFRFLEANDEN